MSDLPSHYRSVFLVGPGRIEIRRPELRLPGPGEVLVRLEAATTCGTDVKVFRRGGHPRMLVPPCPFGHEMSGRIARVGAGVEDWGEGDAVVVANSASCGGCAPCRRGRENLCVDLRYLNGAFSEYLLVPEPFVRRSLYRRPPELDPALAALAEPLACVVHGLERMEATAPGDEAPRDALVLGAGPIGLMFVHLMAADGRAVTLVDPHAERRDLATRLGARHVLSVTELDSATERTDGGFAATVDATGTPNGWQAAISAVRPGGLVNLFGGCAPGTRIEVDATRLHYEEISLIGAYHHRPATFRSALERLAAPGCPLRHLVSRTAPLEGVGAALEDMIARRVVKVAILPRLDEPRPRT